MEPKADYREFFNEAEAEEIAGILASRHIEYELVRFTNPVSDVILGQVISPPLTLKLKPEDFERAEQAIFDHYDQDLRLVSADHYIFQLHTDELYDILTHPDEWSNLDYVLAVRELRKKGITLDAALLKQLREKRLKELSTGKRASTAYLIGSYVAALLFVPIGMAMGLYLWQGTQRLRNGQRSYTFDATSRKQGQAVFFIATGILLLLVVLRLINPEFYLSSLFGSN